MTESESFDEDSIRIRYHHHHHKSSSNQDGDDDNADLFLVKRGFGKVMTICPLSAKSGSIRHLLSARGNPRFFDALGEMMMMMSCNYHFFVDIQSETDVADKSLQVEHRSTLDHDTIAMASVDAFLKWYNNTKGLKDTFLRVGSIVRILKDDNDDDTDGVDDSFASPVDIHMDELLTWRSVNPRKTISETVNIILNGEEEQEVQEKQDKHKKLTAADFPHQPIFKVVEIVLQVIDNIISDANKHAIIKDTVIRILRSFSSSSSNSEGLASPTEIDDIIKEFARLQFATDKTHPVCVYLADIAHTTLSRLDREEEEGIEEAATTTRKWATNAQIVDFDFDSFVDAIRNDNSDLQCRLQEHLNCAVVAAACIAE